MRYELKSVGIWSFIKVAFFLNMIVGFVYGVFLALYFIMTFKFAGAAIMEMSGINPDDINPGIFLVIMPLVTSFFSTVLLTLFELLVVGLYNLFTKFIGGLEFHLVPIQTNQPSQIPITPPVAPLAPVSPVSPVSRVAPIAPIASVAPPPPPPSSAPPVTIEPEKDIPKNGHDDITDNSENNTSPEQP